MNIPTHIRFDWAMKRLLRDKANFGILEGFLSELLHEDIKIDHLAESESNQLSHDDKYNRIDIIAINSKDEIILIEVQNDREYSYFHRMTYGVSKAIAENMNLGMDYHLIKKVYSINILYFDLGQGADYVYHGKTEFKGIHNNDILELTQTQKKNFGKEEVSEIFPEYYLLKVNQFNDLAKNSLDEWIYYLKNNELPEKYKAKGLKEVEKKLVYLSMSEQDQRAYVREVEQHVFERSVEQTRQQELSEKLKEGLEMGLEKGREEGLEKGRKEEKLATAKKMKSLGVDVDIIVETTELTVEEIDEI